jgi:hypothetical protein
MQSIFPLAASDFLGKAQEPIIIFEIHVGGFWINLTDLAGKNYVVDISVSLAGAEMTPNPVVGTWSATISNEDGIFHPDHPTSPYKDYFKVGRLARISVGAKYGGTDYSWQRIIGYMEAPSFSIDDMTISLNGSDYTQRLSDTQFKNPDNYWGSVSTFSTGKKPSDTITVTEAVNVAVA